MPPELDNNKQDPQPQAPSPQAEPSSQSQAPQDTSREDSLRAALSNIPEPKPAETASIKPTQEPVALVAEAPIIEPVEPPAEPTPEPISAPVAPIPRPSPVPVREPKVEIPTEFRAPERSSGGSKKIISIFITILLLGLITVGIVFATKYIGKDEPVAAQGLRSAMTNFLEQDTFAYNITFNYDFTPSGLANDSFSGNVTILTDVIMKDDSLESKGMILMNFQGGDFNTSISYVNKNDDLFLKIDSYNSTLDEESPASLSALTFFPLDGLVGQWLRIPYEDESLTFNLAGDEYASQTEATSELVNRIHSLSNNEDLYKALANQIVHIPEKSSEANLAYSPSITLDDLRVYLEMFGIEDPTETDGEESLIGALQIINDLVVYISTDTQTVSSVTLIDSGYTLEDLTSNANLTITPISDMVFEAPTSFTDIDEILSQLFEFGDL